jgi:hypothetical protein
MSEVKVPLQFMILSETEIANLTAAVNIYLARGWKLWGRPFVFKDEVCQSLVCTPKQSAIEKLNRRVRV